MATARLIPSTYAVSNSSYVSHSNTDNMFANTDSTTYGTFTHNRASTNNTYQAYLRGFNIDDIPSVAQVTDFEVKIKASATGHTTSTSSSYKMTLCHGTTTIDNTYAGSSLSTSVQTITFPNGSTTWEQIVDWGTNFGIRIPLRRNSSNTQDVVHVYGAEILVTYTVPNPRTVSTSLNGNGTIVPSGTNTYYDGQEYELTITPTTKSDAVSLTKNGVDVSSSLVAHRAGTDNSQSPDELLTTSGIQSGSSYASYPVGYTAENPHTYSSNMYASNNSTGYALYSFDFSGIPSGAAIENVEVRCCGSRENATVSTYYRSSVGLYSGDTLKSTEQEFSSTSQQVMTIEDPGVWTRAELQNARLRFTVGYYGGRLYGVTWVVTYSTGSGDPDYYTYSTTITGDTAFVVTIGSSGSTQKVFIKVNGTWVQYSKVYKKINGTWVEQSDPSSVFDTTVNYEKGAS